MPRVIKTMEGKGNILWTETIDDGSSKCFRELIPDIYYDNGKVGFGRKPLYSYQVDINTLKDNQNTSFHIGDGTHGFSMGNGTNSGFLPEIIGVGSDENDAGLYFVGIAGNDVSSNTPLIIIDGRDMYADTLSKRPIFGITSGKYNEYCLLVDASTNLHIEKDIILNGASLLDTIAQLKQEINLLKNR